MSDYETWLENVLKKCESPRQPYRRNQLPQRLAANDEVDSGLLRICSEISQYHWHKTMENFSLTSKHDDDTLLQIDLLQTPFLTTGTTVYDKDRAKARVRTLMKSYQDAKRLQAITDDESINSEILMYIYLGIWICSYWIGAPILECWDMVVQLSNRAKRNSAFPGGAFYDKLGGDLYRCEARQRSKFENNKIFSYRSDEPVFVMTYAPLVLLHDNHIFVNQPWSIERIPGPISELLDRYMCEVGRLSSQYLRLQILRYCRLSRAPLKYAISQRSMIRSLWDIAKQTADSSENGDLRDGIINDNLESLKRECARYLKIFFGGLDPKSMRVAVFTEDAIAHKVLTSCILGQEDGVVANRPNKPAEQTTYCNWIEGTQLMVERDKAQLLWASNKSSYFEHNNSEHIDDCLDFVNAWFDSDVLEDIKQEALHDPSDKVHEYKLVVS